MKKFFTITLLFVIMLLFNNNVLESKGKIESWYINISLGYAMPSYYDEFQQLVDLIDENSSSRIGIHMDLGVYFPHVIKNGLVGVSILNGVGDRFEYENYDNYGSYDEWIQINQYIFGPSLIYYITDYIGKGLFIRTDLGASFAVLNGSEISDYTTDTGWGYLLGLGWSFPVNNETRIHFFIDYSGKSIKDESFYATTFNIGFLF